jgi:F-type H+-transporting ATPase subunit alpha
LNRGQRLTELLKQNQFSPMPVEKQVLSLFAGVNGYIDDLAVTDVRRFEAELISFAENGYPGVLQAIRDKKELSPEIKQQVESLIKEFKQRFAAAKSAAAKA